MRTLFVLALSGSFLLGACSSGEETAGSVAETSPVPTGVSTTTTEPTTTMEVDVSPLPVAGQLKDVLTTGIEEGGGFGVTAAVSAPGFELWAGSAGDSIRTPDGVVVAMEPDMLFEIGSIDKHFTAALALRLQELGLLDLDALLSDWLSGYENLHPDITLRHLLGSTSGVPGWVDHPDSPYRSTTWDQSKWDREWTVDEMLTELVGEPEFVPGEAWRYSTTGFRLVRYVIEEETGQSWATAVREYLLNPAGITAVWEAGEGPVPEGVEIAHEWSDTDGDGSFEDITGRTTAQYSLKPGGLHMSAPDLARWCSALFRERHVLSEDSLAEMTAFRIADDPDEPLAAEYGLGLGKFALPALSGVEHYGHSGFAVGYVSAMIYLPETEACITFMVNDGLTVQFVGEALLTAVAEWS